MDDFSNQPTVLPCAICGRTFRPEALERHQHICEKSKTKKRKVFDSSKQRIESTDILRVNGQQASGSAKTTPKPNWKVTHQELVRNIRAARGDDPAPSTNGDTISGRLRIPPGYVQCPTCNRNFSERAADRHLAWCQEKRGRIPKSSTSAEAAERLKARIKYKVPAPVRKGGTGGTEGQRTTGEKRVTGSLQLHQRTKSSPSVLETDGIKAGAPKRITKKTRPAREESSRKPNDGGVMKFKEKFPNHVSTRSEDGYDPYKKADMQMRELLRGVPVAGKSPRTVPGVRTGGASSTNSIGSDGCSPSSFSSSLSENRLDEEMNFINMKLANLGRSGLTEEFTNNWAKHFADGDQALSQTSDRQTSDREVHLGSSGSDGSIPSVTINESDRLPSVCHQCATVYPLPDAKYCYECGVRRLGVLALH